jgi:hypothetical protein
VQVVALLHRAPRRPRGVQQRCGHEYGRKRHRALLRAHGPATATPGRGAVQGGGGFRLQYIYRQYALCVSPLSLQFLRFRPSASKSRPVDVKPNAQAMLTPSCDAARQTRRRLSQTFRRA